MRIQRLTMRRWALADANVIAALNADPEVMLNRAPDRVRICGGDLVDLAPGARPTVEP